MLQERTGKPGRPRKTKTASQKRRLARRGQVSGSKKPPSITDTNNTVLSHNVSGSGNQSESAVSGCKPEYTTRSRIKRQKGELSQHTLCSIQSNSVLTSVENLLDHDRPLKRLRVSDENSTL